MPESLQILGNSCKAFRSQQTNNQMQQKRSRIFKNFFIIAALFFAWVTKPKKNVHYPTRYYSTTQLLSSLPYPTLPKIEKPLPFRPCRQRDWVTVYKHFEELHNGSLQAFLWLRFRLHRGGTCFFELASLMSGILESILGDTWKETSLKVSHPRHNQGWIEFQNWAHLSVWRHINRRVKI